MCCVLIFMDKSFGCIINISIRLLESLNWTLERKKDSCSFVGGLQSSWDIEQNYWT